MALYYMGPFYICLTQNYNQQKTRTRQKIKYGLYNLSDLYIILL